jgi:hypothetical protein
MIITEITEIYPTICGEPLNLITNPLRAALGFHLQDPILTWVQL